ncbi:MAG: CRISPR-associated endonuclease Cas1, partial [Giesbergeria sp.]|nr:CRISPR-associated endonuclease Cas1 [Giesbergeria sp.]
MASLYVDRRDVHLQHDAGAIAFYENGQRSATVPLAPITRVILRGKVTLEAGLLGHLGEHGIGLLFLTGRQGRPSLLLGRAHNDATRRVAQTRL